jgi:hypothetical protein
VPLTINRPLKDCDTVTAYTGSIGATPAAAVGVVMNSGQIVRASGVCVGAATGTITIAVSTVAGGTVGTFTITGGAGNTGFVDFGAMLANAGVNEGDTVTFTPSGGAVATIPGFFTAVIR